MQKKPCPKAAPTSSSSVEPLHSGSRYCGQTNQYPWSFLVEMGATLYWTKTKSTTEAVINRIKIRLFSGGVASVTFTKVIYMSVIAALMQKSRIRLESNICYIETPSLQACLSIFQQDNTKSHSAPITDMVEKEEGTGTGLPAVLTCPQWWKNFEMKNVTMMTLYFWTP